MIFRFGFRYLLIAFLVSACSSSGGATVDDNQDRPPSFDEMLQELPAYETFDEASYPTEPPVVDLIIEHDVPEDLYAGSLAGSSSGVQKGWRIQVVFAREKMAADQAVDDIHGYLNSMRINNPGVEVFQQNLPVYSVYLQPYFRVRVGDFKSREEAEELFNLILPDYPRAFILVDQISASN